MRTITRTLATLVSVATLLAGASAAHASDGYIGSNPPGTGGDGRLRDVNVRGNVICVNGDAWLVNPNRRQEIPGFPGVRGELWLVRPNSMCPLNGVVTEQQQPRTVFGGSQSALRQAPAGWEVWRFYGTRDTSGESRTVLGYTVSFAATRNWGDTSDVITVTPHPDDRGTPVSGSPWRERQYVNLSRETVTLADANQVSTNPPFHFAGRTCVQLRNPNATRQALSADPASVRDTLFTDYSRLMGAASGRWSWRTATTAINAANGGPISDPSQIVYDNGIDCTSPYEYAAFTSGQLSIAGVYQGACIVPITRLQQQLTDGSWAPLHRYGARYSSEYGPSNDHQAWRDIIKAEVTDRTSSRHLVNHSHRTPGQPSPVRTGGGDLLDRYNQDAAAAAASRFASCREGLLGLTGNPASGTSQPRVIIDVELPEVFQIGGQLRPDQTIWAGHSQLLCDGGACPTRTGRQLVQTTGQPRALTADHLTRVRYQLTIQIPGLRLCRTVNPAEQCDYTLDGPHDRTGWTAYPPQPANEPRGPSAQQSAAAHRERRQRIDLTFYAATNPGERVTVGIRDVSATYATYEWGRTQIGVTSCIQNVDGAPLGTTVAASPGSEARRWDRAPYHPDTPGGTVTQWQDLPVYDEINHGEPQIDPRTGAVYYGYPWNRRSEPWIERTNERIERFFTEVPQWVCRTGVFDDVEISHTIDIPASDILVRGLGSRPVIGVNQRSPY